jgi:hypothetical protein
MSQECSGHSGAEKNSNVTLRNSVLDVQLVCRHFIDPKTLSHPVLINWRREDSGAPPRILTPSSPYPIT